MFVLLEPTEAAYNVLDDDALLFEAAKAVVAQKLVREAEEAAPLVDKPAYLKERRDAEKNISDRLRAAYGRLLLWKSPPVSYDESELDPIGLKGNHFTYDAALAELKGFALDRDTHRRDVLNHLDQFRSLTVPIIEQTFRATLGLHIPVPKDIIGDTLIQMAKDYEISLVHPSHTYCGPEDYSKLTGNQRLELGRCTLAEPLPERAPPTIAPPQPVIPPVTPSPGPSGGEISNARTELLPHQILLVHRVANAARRRYLIADEVGLGKTIETGMALRELMSRGEADRVLIVTPAGLTLNWLDELEDKFGLSPTVLGEDFDDARGDAWLRNPLAIASIDRLKRKERLRRLMQAPNWDIVIIDEAHHLAKYRSGKNKVRTTQNYRLAEVLRQKTRDLLLLSATPHQGDEHRFYFLLSLLDDQLFSSAEEVAERRDKLDQIMIRRTKREVTDVEGSPIFAKRIVHTEGFTLSAAERRFYDELNDYLVEGYNLAESDPSDARKRAVGFVMTTFQKLASSSPRAIRAALLKHLLRLLIRKATTLEELLGTAHGRAADREELDGLRTRSIALAREIWFLPDTEQGRLDAEQRILHEKRELTKRRTKADLEDAIDAAENLDDIGLEIFEALYVGIPDEIQKIEELLAKFPDRVDRKLDRLLRAVDRLRAETPSERFIIFTQYRQTQEYLRERLRERYGGDQVVIIKGGDIHEKRKAAAEFRRDGGARFLLSTSAGGEGINLQICRVLFNYDLPWNPMAVEQRIGRIHRYGQQHTAQVYNLVATDTIEGTVHLQLQEKLRKIAAAIGKINEEGAPREDFLSAILGPLSERLDYVALYREALMHRDFDRTAEEIEEAVRNAVSAGDVLDSLCQGLEPFNLEKYREIRGDVTWGDLAQFVTRALAEMGAAVAWQNELLTCDLPEMLSRRAGLRNRYERLTFDRRRAMNSPDVELAGIGHPLVDALLAHFRSPNFTGLACLRRVDGVNGPHESLMQFNYLVHEHRDGVSESVVVVPVADGREYLPELSRMLVKRAGHGALSAPTVPVESREVAEGAMAMLLAQRASTEPGIPREYHLDSVAVIAAGKSIC